MRRGFSDFALVDPFDKEGAVRINRADNDASFGRAPLEEDFMGGWYRLVDHAQGMIWTPNVAFSRDGNWEEMRGIFCALGYLNGITRDSADFKFYRIDRSYSPFAERLQYNLDYLIYAAENDFHASEAATCAAWKLEIAARLLDDDYNAKSYHPIDINAIDPMLRAEFKSDAPWAKAAREHIAKLRAALEPLLLGHFATHIREEHITPLDDRYKAARAEGVKTFTGWGDNEPDVVRDARARLADLDIYRTADPSDPKIAFIDSPKEKGPTLSPAYNALAAQRQLAHKDNVFDVEKYRASIFEDDDYASLTKRERIVLQRILGAMLTMVPPLTTPGYKLVLADLEKGSNGVKVAKKNKLADLNQLREVVSDPKEFAETIETPNFEELKKLEEKVNASEGAPVISTAQIVGIQQAYAWLPQVTAVPGFGPTSPEFRMALRLKIMDLMASTVVLERDWAVSDDHVRHVVRATLIQLGLVERGHMHATDLVLKNHDLKDMGFADRFEPVMDHLQKCVTSNVKARNHALAALRLIECYEMLVDPSVRAGTIDVNAIHESLLADRHNHAARKDLAARYKAAREFIFENCIDWLEEEDLKDLNQDVRSAWKEIRGKKAIAFTPSQMPAIMGARFGMKPK